MTWSRESVDACLRRVPDWAQVALAFAFLAALAALAFSSGRGLVLIDLLIVPVVVVAWLARARWLGYLVAVVAAVDSAFISAFAITGSSTATALASGTARCLLYLAFVALLDVLRRERAETRRAAAIDRQTGVLNARTFRERAGQQIELARRYPRALSLAYLDLDNFKAVNDQLGHAEGDRVLLEVSHVLRSEVRAVDSVGRLGGDEFAVLMPHTGGAEARDVVARLGGQLKRISRRDGRALSCSVGVVTFNHAPASVAELLDAGDELMYRAKQGGKDQIACEERLGTLLLPDACPRSRLRALRSAKGASSGVSGSGG